MGRKTTEVTAGGQTHLMYNDIRVGLSSRCAFRTHPTEEVQGLVITKCVCIVLQQARGQADQAVRLTTIAGYPRRRHGRNRISLQPGQLPLEERHNRINRLHGQLHHNEIRNKTNRLRGQLPLEEKHNRTNRLHGQLRLKETPNRSSRPKCVNIVLHKSNRG